MSTIDIPALEQALQDAVSADALQAHLETFSTLFRDSGTDDERKAAQYIFDTLTSYGLSPKIETFRSYLSWPREGSLTITLADGTTEDIPVRTRSFGAQTPEGGLNGELVFVPFKAPGKGEMIFSHRAVAADYSGLDVTGKIVITSDGGPDGIRRAQERGALAHIHIWPSDEGAIHEMIGTPVWGTPTPETASRIPKIPALGVKNADGTHLEELVAAGTITANLVSNVDTEWAEVPLVSVDIPGTESDRFLLVGAHIDSWYEGITDNATGDASLIEMARVLNGQRDQLRYGLRFAWWPCHSTGRYAGSTWYADNHFTELRAKAIGYLNIDSPGTKGAEVWECRYNSGEIENVVASSVRDLSGQDPEIRRPLKAADQSFLGVGLPSLGAYTMLPVDHPDRKAVGGCGGAWWWHTPFDTIDKADKEVLAADTQVYVTIAARMCTPVLHPYNFVPVANDFIDTIAPLQETVGSLLDLTEVLDQAIAFGKAAADLAVFAGGELDAAKAEQVNRGYLKLSRLVNPALFTIVGPYEFDPALQLPVLPALAGANELATLDPESDRYGFLRTQLIRQRNRITDILATATEIATDLIA